MHPVECSIMLSVTYRLNPTLFASSSLRACPAPSVPHVTRVRARSLRMASVEQEVIAVTQKLLNSIAGGDWQTYQTLCAKDLTCFEPEASGNLVEGLDFHKYYFDNIDYKASSESQKANKPILLNTIASPKVRVIGDCAVITYVRLTQKGGSAPVTARAEETRVWEKRGGNWVLVHFHKSIPA
uniref:Calcium/calmodulin-dependent protein kinase II association-domain domain-containing protein n=1 Tax=Chlamydomonas chlamydogama TaxID=225041 RepID=A0A7S2VV91_9CHLO|mmetsp:Transcript_1229/g.2660  ORF Transcript_1229/g.2660 Transcript_1229/m.2660 type:complete len:183 (+) Transcript_1229:23-571(+)